MNFSNSMTDKTERLKDKNTLADQWESIDWRQVQKDVNRLQTRIAKATVKGDKNKVKRLQYLLTHSFCAKAHAVKKVTSNKGKNKKRPLGIPTMNDRAMQTLYGLALEPVAETTGDHISFGFRKGRSAKDAREQIFCVLARKCSPTWILEGDQRLF